MSSDAFGAALAFVLDREGRDRITDDPHDPGGLTKWGISLRAYPQLGQAGIRALTEAQATNIYRRDYWQAGACQALPPGLAVFHFDTAVNLGCGGAAKLLQAAAGVAVDGAIGPKTLAAVQRQRPAALLAEMAARRLIAYAGMAGFHDYGLGWVRRVIACQALASAWL